MFDACFLGFYGAPPHSPAHAATGTQAFALLEEALAEGVAQRGLARADADGFVSLHFLGFVQR